MEKTSRKRKRRMRLPPGMGSVHKIGDGKNRRKPWRARVQGPVEFDEKAGTATQKYITIGYYETEEQAIEALIEYRKNPYSLEASKATFRDVYEAWSERKYPATSTENERGYRWAYEQSKALHHRRMRDLRAADFEMVMLGVKVGFSMQNRLRTLWSQMYKYAMENDIAEKNYAQFVTTKDKEPESTRTAIAREDIEKLWKETDEGNRDAKLALIFIYTGMRATELLEMKKESVDLTGRMMVGGKKTEAGKNRRIPIHNAILPFVRELMATDGPWLVSREKGSANKPMAYSTWRHIHWDRLMGQIGATYTTHYTRHTFTTMMKEAEVADDIIKVILGHSTKDITARYTHYSDDLLLESIDKLPGREE